MMKSATSFIIGFACGVLCLAVVLWSTGHLVLTSAQAARPEAAPAPVAAPSLPAVPDAPEPSPARLPATPPAVVEPTPSKAMPKLAMPIAGVNPSALHSNFEEGRSGHRHEALDIMAPRGTPVLAAAEGNVMKLFNSKQGGLTVYQFDNTQHWCYYYAHLDRYATGLKEGTLLRKGEILGYVGSTGDASPDAPHLHFAVFELGPEKQWWKGTAIDPLPLLQ